MPMLPTNVREYVLALVDAGLRRFPDETRPCRTLLIVSSANRRVKVDVPDDMLHEERQHRHALALQEVAEYCREYPEGRPTIPVRERTMA